MFSYCSEPCPEAFPEYWIEYVNTHLYSGVANSASDLASCQSYCSSHSSCTRVDWNPAASVGQQCWIHGSWSSSQSRRPASGINHYELKRMAVGHWVMYSDAYVSRGIASGAAELGDCQASCISNVGCTRIDWSPTAADGQRCWLHGSWSGSEPRRSRQGFTHYELYRGNDGLCGKQHVDRCLHKGTVQRSRPEGHTVERMYLRHSCSNFPQLAVNNTILKPRVALATGAQYLCVGFSRCNKIPHCSAYDIGESNLVPASGL